MYGESSAVLAWLLDEESGPQVRQLLATAKIVAGVRRHTLIECDRVLLRAAALGELTEAEAADRRAHLARAASHWHALRIGPEIVARAPAFSWRTYSDAGAIHLTSVLVAGSAAAGLELLSLDDRIRRAARRLGLRVRPASIRRLQQIDAFCQGVSDAFE